MVGLRRVRGEEAAALGLADDAIHHTDGLQREFAAGGFGREHHGVGAREHGVRHVAGLRARRARRIDHGREHFGRHDHGLSVDATGADDLLLEAAFVLGRGQMAQSAFERAVQALVGIEFRTVAGQVMHGDGLAMFLQPRLHRLAVMHPQIIQNQKGKLFKNINK